jgi:hypothetical protein
MHSNLVRRLLPESCLVDFAPLDLQKVELLGEIERLGGVRVLGVGELVGWWCEEVRGVEMGCGGGDVGGREGKESAPSAALVVIAQCLGRLLA